MNSAPELFESGIQTENSDVRAHVSVVNRTIYVFPTRNGIEVIKNIPVPSRSAGQPGVNGPTAVGWLVRPDMIADMRRLRFESWPRWGEFSEALSTSEKGSLAVDAVISSMRLGRFPFWIDATEDERQSVQLKGTDILIFCRKRVQVKCDYRGGDRPLGTGNLFLQQAERNPLKRY